MASILGGPWMWPCCLTDPFSFPMTLPVPSTGSGTKAAKAHLTGAPIGAPVPPGESIMKFSIALVGLGASLTVLGAVDAGAGDARAGRQKLTTCQGCHGLDG